MTAQVSALGHVTEPVYDPQRLASAVTLHLVGEGVAVSVRSAERVFETCARLLRDLGVEAVDDYADLANATHGPDLAPVIPLQRRVVDRA